MSCLGWHASRGGLEKLFEQAEHTAGTLLLAEQQLVKHFFILRADGRPESHLGEGNFFSRHLPTGKLLGGDGTVGDDHGFFVPLVPLDLVVEAQNFLGITFQLLDELGFGVQQYARNV